MKLSKLPIIIILTIILFFSGFIFLKVKYGDNKKQSVSDKIKNTELINYLAKTEIGTGGTDNLKEIFGDEIKNYNENIKSGDYLKAIDSSDKIINFVSDNSRKIVNINNLGNDENRKIIKVAAKILKIKALLNYGNSFYKEKEYSAKAESEIKNISEIDNSLLENPYGMYYLGYSKEITKDYINALDFYKKGLEYGKNDKYIIAVISNQIGHVYDLIGDMKDAGEYYLYSEKLGQELPANILNRGRYEYRNNNFDTAEKYFNKLLQLKIGSFTKAEIYFNLSSIYLTKKDGIDKAIEYANLGIKSNKLYPNNYISLGIGYINKGGSDLDKAKDYLDNATKLYLNSSAAYKWLGVYFYIKDDYKNAIVNFEKQLEVSSNDITLMQNEREKSRKSALYDLSKTYALNQNIDKSLFYLNQLLDGKDKDFYSYFLAELSIKNGPFEKIKSDSKFITNLQKIISLYK